MFLEKLFVFYNLNSFPVFWYLLFDEKNGTVEDWKLKIFNLGICAAAQPKVPLIENAAYAAECEEIMLRYLKEIKQ